MDAESRRRSREYDEVMRQGAALLGVAQALSGNSEATPPLRSITFSLGQNHPLTLRTIDGFAIEAKLDASWSTLLSMLVAAREAPSDPPTRLGRDATAASQNVFAELLRDLGANADALVLYRLDVPPLRFVSITNALEYFDIEIGDFDDNIKCASRFTVSDARMPIAGELYGIVDECAALY